MFLLNWLSFNEKWLSLVMSFISVVLSSLLTFLIIHQTNKLNKKQVEFELSNHLNQIEIQKRQIKLDSYPYKREIYYHVFSVLELCEQLQEISKTLDLYSMDPNKINEMLITLQKQYVPDANRALWSMREAEYVLPKNISNVVIDIRKNYDSMCSSLIYLVNFSKIMIQNEMEDEFNKQKKSSIDNAIICCNRINKHVIFIESIMPEELNISELSR